MSPEPPSAVASPARSGHPITEIAGSTCVEDTQGEVDPRRGRAHLTCPRCQCLDQPLIGKASGLDICGSEQFPHRAGDRVVVATNDVDLRVPRGEHRAGLTPVRRPKRPLGISPLAAAKRAMLRQSKSATISVTAIRHAAAVKDNAARPPRSRVRRRRPRCWL